MSNSIWVEKLLELQEEAKKGGYKPYFDLNEFAFEKLKTYRKTSSGVISFLTIRTNLCRNFSIKKAQCLDLLRRFESQGRLEFVHYKGIRIKSERIKKV